MPGFTQVGQTGDGSGGGSSTAVPSPTDAPATITPGTTPVTSAVTPGSTDPTGFVTPQSASAGQGLGAYDVWSSDAFNGPTDAEQALYDPAAALATGTDTGSQQASGLINQATANAAGQGTQAQSNNQLQAAWTAANNMYTGNDQSSVPINAQQAQYMTMTGPNAGYDAATQAAITNQGNNALNSQEASMRDQLNNAAARTGSPVGAYGALVDVNQNIGNQRADQSRQNQVLFANEAERQKEAGAAGLGSTANEIMARQNAAQQSGLAANQAQFSQDQTATNQANQLINDQTSRQLAGINSGVAQNAQQIGVQEAGGAGLTNILQGQNSQQDQLYSMLASILGNKQGDTSNMNVATTQAGVSV
jgi:hypothetical protein